MANGSAHLRLPGLHHNSIKYMVVLPREFRSPIESFSDWNGDTFIVLKGKFSLQFCSHESIFDPRPLFRRSVELSTQSCSEIRYTCCIKDQYHGNAVQNESGGATITSL